MEGKRDFKHSNFLISHISTIFALAKHKLSMVQQTMSPDYIFETSWEVCNKVGGIYTVLSSRAKTLQEKFSEHVFFIGPDLHTASNTTFTEEKKLCTEWKKAAAKEGLAVRIGRWEVPGSPIAILVDFQPLFEQKDAIYAQAYNDFGVDSLHAYGDYDEASMFSVAAGRFVEAVCRHCICKEENVI